MSAARVLWLQIAVVLLIVLVAVWTATQWTAWRLGFQTQLGQPWFEQSRSIVAEAAIASFLSPDADEYQEAAIAKRLDRSIQRLERDIGIANEAFAIFIRNWLTSTASLVEVGQAAHAKGGERYDRFPQVLGKRLAKGPRLRQEVPEEIDPAQELSGD